MKGILLFLIAGFAFSVIHGQTVLRSGKKHINVLVNEKITDWEISPESKPDRLRVYCFRDKNEVVFQTNIDTTTFYVAKNDTIKFNIILNDKDTAHTEIVGIKDLPNKISKDDKLYWLSQIWSETKYNFVNFDTLKLNFDSLYKAYIPLVLATKNDYEYYKVLKSFLANLHDGHTEVFDNGQFYLYTDYIPILLQDFNKKIYITSVRKMPEQDSTWIGAELIEIDGIPTVRYLETKVFPTIAASTEQHLWMQGVYRLHSDLRDNPFRGTIKKSDGKIVKINLQRNGEAIRTDNEQYWGPQYQYSRNIVDLKWTDNNIAVVSFNSFNQESRAIKEFDKVAKDLYKAKGVIIDLRKNGGGSTLVALHLQKYLTKAKYFLNYAWETRTNDGVRKANGNWKGEYKDYFLNKALRFERPDTVFVSDTLRRISCPTAILIGRYTFSAAEDFLVNIYETPGRPMLIGEETGGSTGSPLVVSGLPGGGYVRICTRRICFPLSRRRFVNTGIKPDIEVKQTIDDYLKMKDPVLERAIKEINNAAH
jgi:hypothetical protein